MGFYSAASLVPGSFSNPSSKMHVYLIYLFLHTICFNSLVWLTSNATFWDSGLWVFFSLSFLWDWPLHHHRQGHNVENWIDPNDHDFPDLKALHSQDWKGSHCVSDTYPQQWPKCKYGYSWVHVGIQFGKNSKNVFGDNVWQCTHCRVEEWSDVKGSWSIWHVWFTHPRDKLFRPLSTCHENAVILHFFFTVNSIAQWAEVSRSIRQRTQWLQFSRFWTKESVRWGANPIIIDVPHHWSNL